MKDTLKKLFENETSFRVILVIVTAMITHFFTMLRIRRERTLEYKAELGKKIGNAYIDLREIISKLSSIEIYTVTDKFPSNSSIFVLKDNAVYPSFMSTYNSLCVFLKEVSEARSRHEDYLDLYSASMLYCLERYLFSLTCYIAENKYIDKCDLIGCIAIVDIKKIHLSFDKLLVKRLNKPLYKLFHKKSIVWKFRKIWVERKYLKESYLNKLIEKTFEIPN